MGPLGPPPDEGGFEGFGADDDEEVGVDGRWVGGEYDGCAGSLLVGADEVGVGVAVGLGFGAMPSSPICCVPGSFCSAWPLR